MQPDGSTVLLGTALWLSAEGERLWKEGVAPDREVELPLDATPSRPVDDGDLTATEWAAVADPQLKAAVDELRVAGAEVVGASNPAGGDSPAG